MRFFPRKTKANGLPVKHLNNTTAEARNIVKRDGRNQSSGAKPGEVTDKRHDANALSPPTDKDIHNEIRDDIFIHSIITSSGSTEDVLDETSNVSFSSESETPRLKAYVVEHLLGCVDFIEECAGTISNATFNNGATCNGVNMQECQSLESDNIKFGILTQHVVEETKPAEVATTKAMTEITSPEGTKPITAEVVTDPNKSKPIEGATEGTALLASKQAEGTNDILARLSGADATVPRSSYNSVAPKTHDDFLAILAEVDKIIDIRVARICGELCVSGEDEVSIFSDPKVSPNDYEYMLFT